MVEASVDATILFFRGAEKTKRRGAFYAICISYFLSTDLKISGIIKIAMKLKVFSTVLAFLSSQSRFQEFQYFDIAIDVMHKAVQYRIFFSGELMHYGPVC